MVLVLFSYYSDFFLPCKAEVANVNAVVVNLIEVRSAVFQATIYKNQ